MTDDPESLRVVVGRSVARVRRRAGARQEDVAAAARLLGYAWNRSKIATLERGMKSINAEELLCLPLILGVACARHVSLSELFEGDEEVALSTAVRVPARALAGLLAGDAPTEVVMPPGAREAISTGSWDFDPMADHGSVVSGGGGHPLAEFRLNPESQVRRVEEAEAEEEIRTIKNLGARALIEAMPIARRAYELGLWEEGGTVGDVTRWMWLGGESEELAGRRLGEPPAIIVALSLAEWGRTLTAERERILQERQVPSAATRDTVRTVRGRITRNLLNQLAGQIRLRELAAKNNGIKMLAGRSGETEEVGEDERKEAP